MILADRQDPASSQPGNAPANTARPASVRIGGDGRLESELKFALPVTRVPIAIRLLEGLCDPDPDFPIGIVSSIYYDSRDWAYLGEKRNSDFLKTKVRLRWYEMVVSSSPQEDKSFAEVKMRTGSKRTKIRMPTSYLGADLAAMELHDRELLQIPAALIARGAPISRAIFPAFTVRYTRRRYIERSTHTRIAIDYAITAPKVNKYMISNAFPCALGFAVLEVKGTDGNFPIGLRSAFKLGFRREAFSKYYECYAHLTRTVF